MWSKVEISISCQAKIVIYEWSKMQQKSNLNLSEPTFDLCYNPTNYKSNILTFIWRFEIRHRPFNSKGTKTNFYLFSSQTLSAQNQINSNLNIWSGKTISICNSLMQIYANWNEKYTQNFLSIFLEIPWEITVMQTVLCSYIKIHSTLKIAK